MRSPSMVGVARVPSYCGLRGIEYACFQATSPVLASKQVRTSSLPLRVNRYTLPSRAIGLEWPVPTSSTSQSRFGPSLGQVEASSSLLMLSPRGPSHFGQSSAAAAGEHTASRASEAITRELNTSSLLPKDT